MNLNLGSRGYLLKSNGGHLEKLPCVVFLGNWAVAFGFWAEGSRTSAKA